MSHLPKGDTIAAIATPTGHGGIGIVRVSGPLAYAIGLRLSGCKTLGNRHATFCRVLAEDGVAIDEGVVLFFKQPASYTGEDVLEAHAHGSPAALEMLLARTVELGARIAEPGEFSRRAFLNGKRDLAQLEAVADLISSASQQAARSAQRVMQGEFSDQVRAMCDEIKSLRTLIEATLDFPDEEDVVNDHTLRQTLHTRLDTLARQLAELESRAVSGAQLREGIELVIAGQPNVGKSSLLNYLAERETAIVCDAPGTTRDIVRCDILIDGIPIRVLDTAGIRLAAAAVEQEGIRRAHSAMEAADVIVLLVDATSGLADIESDLLAELAGGDAAVIVAFNKSDLMDAGRRKPDTLYISAKTGDGMDGLCSAIKKAAGVVDLGEDALVVRRRYLDAIASARGLLAAVLQKTGGDYLPLDALAQDLRDVHQMLSALTGEYTTEEMLGDIFSRFCIGK